MTRSDLRLPTAFRDASAADLRLRLDLPGQEALASRVVACGGWSIDLRILSASHQVLVAAPGSDVWSETVACAGVGAGLDAALPARYASDRTGVRYRFRSATSCLGAAAFRTTVDRLLTTLAHDPTAVCGVFPGDASGMTGVQARFRSDRVASWRTWHTYPQTGEVVVTCSRVERRPARVPTTVVA